MYQLLLIIAIIVCVLLVGIVLIQNPKGGGLSSNFSSSSQLMGVQKTGDFIEKGTWFLAIFLMVLAMAINVSVKGGTQQVVDKYKEQKTNVNKPSGQTAPPLNLSGSSAQPAGGQKAAPKKP